LWTRGFRKGDPRVGRWIAKVAPSTELRKWYSREAARFDEFAGRYAAELETEEVTAALAAVVVACFAVKPPTMGIAVAAAVAVVTLPAQVLVVRPRLTRRSDAALADGEGPRSRAHWGYVGLEIVKVIAGVSLLAT
jgi:hypothetical protein